MKCVEVKALLSAYLDQEAPTEKQGAIAKHLIECQACSRQLREFEALSVLTRTLSHPLPPKDAWQSIDSALAQEQDDAHAAELERVGNRRLKLSRGAGFAVMLTIAVALFSGWIAIRQWAHLNDENQMAAVFERYLDVFSRDPIAAQNILLTSFVGRKVPEGQAVSMVGYRPLIAKGAPKGYSIGETFVIKMPCCVCVYCRCQRPDGTSIAILEHNDAEPSWFASKKKVEAYCSGISCELVTLDQGIAATWKKGNRYITVVGGQNTAEVDFLVGWFDKRR